MKALFSIICLNLCVALFGQVNDEIAFFRGTYDRIFVKNHNIKQVVAQTYIAGSKSSRSVFEFDSNGALIKQMVFDTNSNKKSQYFFTYNENDDLLERKSLSYELKKIYSTTFKNVYSNSLLILETSTDLPFVTTHKYDQTGKRIQTIVYLNADTAGSSRRLFLHSYDTSGRLSTTNEYFIYDLKSRPVNEGETKYHYDKNGHLYYVFREGKASYTLNYNNDGLLITKKVTMPEEFNNLTIVDNYSYSFFK